ncbi:hypothetical protein EJ04DRAFT_68151 [Polyplosphaeria fusca]|uniref:Uncharacterized protein n=1 Tax=Polyplosphaeria fusca TaxID=682080 RepID=A0A9P4V334_9PLEO|nr:hypothetical protein EJ04DRAFT_68151 [Polyplosphaeria fusca]
MVQATTAQEKTIFVTITSVVQPSTLSTSARFTPLSALPLPTMVYQTASQDTPTKKSDLSPGAQAGIVIAVVAAFVLAFAIGVCFRKRRRAAYADLGGEENGKPEMDGETVGKACTGGIEVVQVTSAVLEVEGSGGASEHRVQELDGGLVGGELDGRGVVGELEARRDGRE